MSRSSWLNSKRLKLALFIYSVSTKTKQTRKEDTRNFRYLYLTCTTPTLLLLSLPLLLPLLPLLRVVTVLPTSHQELIVAPATYTRPCRLTRLLLPSSPLRCTAASNALSDSSAVTAAVSPRHICGPNSPLGVDSCALSIYKTLSASRLTCPAVTFAHSHLYLVKPRPLVRGLVNFRQVLYPYTVHLGFGRGSTRQILLPLRQVSAYRPWSLPRFLVARASL